MYHNEANESAMQSIMAKASMEMRNIKNNGRKRHGEEIMKENGIEGYQSREIMKMANGGESERKLEMKKKKINKAGVMKISAKMASKWLSA